MFWLWPRPALLSTFGFPPSAPDYSRWSFWICLIYFISAKMQCERKWNLGYIYISLTVQLLQVTIQRTLFFKEEQCILIQKHGLFNSGTAVLFKGEAETQIKWRKHFMNKSNVVAYYVTLSTRVIAQLLYRLLLALNPLCPILFCVSQRNELHFEYSCSNERREAPE